MMRHWFLYGCSLLLVNQIASALPTGFVDLKTLDATIVQDIRYATSHNFVGRPLPGYEAARCILTQQAAQRLVQLQKTLRQRGLGIKVFDCYRPQATVNEFVRWSQDAHDQRMKSEFYPNENKATLFQHDYISKTSGHTRGSTVDITLVQLPSQTALPMGTSFDYLDPQSHFDASSLSAKAHQNRVLLREVMQRAGFKGIVTEWWHFTLIDEPYPQRYFNFPIN